jgi:hypothetical protein
MGKKASQSGTLAPLLFVDTNQRRHPTLFLPRLLAEEAERPYLQGPNQDHARNILLQWADLAEQGHLNQKETALDAEFLQKVFGEALGYRSVSESPTDYHREKQFHVPGAGTADGALGRFATATTPQPIAIIELKGANTDLDHDKFNGRTPVQQCWDYLAQLPDTPWGIVSNYITIRLYHRERPQRAYEEFTVADFRDEARFRQFYYLFQHDALLGNKVQAPRALELLKRTASRQREVGNDLYEDYNNQRLHLIDHLMHEHGKSQDEAIHIAQKLLDRIIFVAFCEDRALLPENVIHRAYRQLPAFTKVTNPRWQNFKNLFGLIDQGHEPDGIPGFNGGLFKNDAAVDHLELDDQWTHFFDRVADYDFRDEVNVDVLGHIFERSITELEKLRVVGLFGKQNADAAIAAMPKSAERKRFGIYYTPPEFTRLIVENTLGALIEQRVETVSDLAGRGDALRKIKVCDPACGSGAFLIAAYEKLEEAYENIARLLRLEGRLKEAEALQRQYPDYILSENLYGVDLSPESVKIAQLALWIRSARKGRTLADLSGNIVCGNSLICDSKTHERGFTWAQKFPAVFSGANGGFDVVIGNPPWERMKLQEREFFSLGAPEIAAAVNAADRRKLIAQVEAKDPDLWRRYQNARTAAERTLDYVRSCGEYPLTGRGDVNTYMLFAELARKIVAPTGRVGLLVPSGIATDDTTKHFFQNLMETRTLVALYDFENRKLIFPDVDGRFKFSILLMGGSKVQTKAADFVFFAHRIEDLQEKDRHIDLTEKDLKLLNPNTRTCPIFRCKRDADLTRTVYRNVPILIDDSRKDGGNPWGIKFSRVFDQDNAAEHFRQPDTLTTEGLSLHGNCWHKRQATYLPLYEAKMVQAYDHRAASVLIDEANWMRKGQTEATSLVQHQNPEFVAMPVYWVDKREVDTRMDGHIAPAYLAYKKVTSATNQRTMIAAFVPYAAFVDSLPVLFFDKAITYRRQCCLLANLNALAYDFVARQKVGGLHLNFFIVEQLPTLPPTRYDDKCPWDKKTTLETWIADRVLKLTCTANDMLPLAAAAAFTPRAHKWKDDERAKLRAELDAAFFILYGLKRDDIDYILTTFQAVAREDQAHAGEGPTRRLILEVFDSLDPLPRLGASS